MFKNFNEKVCPCTLDLGEYDKQIVVQPKDRSSSIHPAKKKAALLVTISNSNNKTPRRIQLAQANTALQLDPLTDLQDGICLTPPTKQEQARTPMQFQTSPKTNLNLSTEAASPIMDEDRGFKQSRSMGVVKRYRPWAQPPPNSENLIQSSHPPQLSTSNYLSVPNPNPQTSLPYSNKPPKDSLTFSLSSDRLSVISERSHEESECSRILRSRRQSHSRQDRRFSGLQQAVYQTNRTIAEEDDQINQQRNNYWKASDHRQNGAEGLQWYYKNY